MLEPIWAKSAPGEQESDEVHIPWVKVAGVKLTATNSEVRENIHHDFQLTFEDNDWAPLSWFYIKDRSHPAADEKSLRDGKRF